MNPASVSIAPVAKSSNVPLYSPSPMSKNCVLCEHTHLQLSPPAHQRYWKSHQLCRYPQQIRAFVANHLCPIFHHPSRCATPRSWMNHLWPAMYISNQDLHLIILDFAPVQKISCQIYLVCKTHQSIILVLVITGLNISRQHNRVPEQQLWPWRFGKTSVRTTRFQGRNRRGDECFRARSQATTAECWGRSFWA